MTEAVTIQVYVIATAISTVCWLAYVAVATSRMWCRVELEHRDPFLRHGLAGTFYIVIGDLIGTALLTGVFLYRNFFGLGLVLEVSPASMGYLLFAQYALIYILATMPATLLYMAVINLDEIARERRRKTA